MESISERWSAMWGRLRQTPTVSQSWLPIPPERVDDSAGLGDPLKANQQYFEVRINELFLAHEREWFKRYDPMVLAITEFSYAGQQTVVPFVIGPSMLESTGSPVPLGMVLANTRVAGPHPYRGDGLTLTVILYRTVRDDYARKLISLVEGTAGALSFAAPVSAYLKVAGVVLDGLEMLTGTGGKLDALLGRCDSFNPVEPGYFLLTSALPSQLTDLWVRDRKLVQGSTRAEAIPFRGADYVLVSVVPTMREDVSTLPFHALWRSVLQEANKSSKPDVWENAKVNMAALLGMLDTSPDLTEAHALALGEDWIAKMEALHLRAVRVATLDGESTEEREEELESDLDRVRDRALRVLRL